MNDRDTIDIVVALGDVQQRPAAAKALAERLRVTSFLLFVRDPALPVLIPAPGFPQTLRGGAAWRDFIGRCLQDGNRSQEVDFPAGERNTAFAHCGDGVAAVLVGGSPDESQWRVVQRLLPLVAAALRSEQQAIFANGDAHRARAAAHRAEDLASALDAARAQQAKLNARLHEEHRRKDDFLAMLGHELRNPLAPLVSSLELLRRPDASPDATKRYVEIISRGVRLMSRLVEDLLDVSRVSRGRIELRRRRVLISEVLADAVENSRPVIEARHHEIHVDAGTEPLAVDADPVRLSQVFGNLLHNAAKYTDAGGRIDVIARRDGDSVAITVRDNGIGIAQNMLPRVFDLFSQAPVSLARSQGGLGIGLTLVRALVELHGGSISANSPGLGGGSSFTVKLPLTTLAAQAASSPPQAPAYAPASAGLSVLIVDDNEDAAESLAEVVKSMGHRAHVAYTALSALQVAADLAPDLILLDLGLPDLDGLETARRLRRMLASGTRLVAVTGYAADEDRRRTREAGFDQHMAKPVMPEALAEVLQKTQPRAPVGALS